MAIISDDEKFDNAGRREKKNVFVKPEKTEYDKRLLRIKSARKVLMNIWGKVR